MNNKKRKLLAMLVALAIPFSASSNIKSQNNNDSTDLPKKSNILFVPNSIETIDSDIISFETDIRMPFTIIPQKVFAKEYLDSLKNKLIEKHGIKEEQFNEKTNSVSIKYSNDKGGYIENENTIYINSEMVKSKTIENVICVEYLNLFLAEQPNIHTISNNSLYKYMSIEMADRIFGYPNIKFRYLDKLNQESLIRIYLKNDLDGFINLISKTKENDSITYVLNFYKDQYSKWTGKEVYEKQDGLISEIDSGVVLTKK